MEKWKNSESKLQQRRQMKRQKKFYGEATPEKTRKTKAIIREQKQEKEDAIDKSGDES